MEAIKPLVLLILDGFGISAEKNGNAISLAKTPNLKKISEEYAGTTLRASGIEVGLGWGEMGSSEVGHSNLGAGIVLYQNLPRIDLSIGDGSFYSLSAWEKIVSHAEKNGSAIHLMGLVSNGGIHSHIEHLLALLKTIENIGYRGNIFIHMFTDGQDTAPQSALKFLQIVQEKIDRMKNVKIASVTGRYYSMDKNENWDRTAKAYNCIVLGEGKTAGSAAEAIEAAYNDALIDETLEPTVIVDSKKIPIGLVKDGDAVVFFNFRADRARQITQAFIFPEFKIFERKKLSGLEFVSMTNIGIEYPIDSAFEAQAITRPLAKVISDAGKKQFHIAETEKYAHITYFFNGGTEKPVSGEDRVIIPSQQIKSYDLKPEMSAHEITTRAVKEIKKNTYDFLVINLANGDMVGHTGNLKAAIKAVEVLDECVGEITKAVLDLDGTLIITGDHGNVEEMINAETGEIDKEHSINPVPFWLIGKKYKKEIKSDLEIPGEPGGILADVAATILEIMDIPKPQEMTGNSLLNIISDCPLPK